MSTNTLLEQITRLAATRQCVVAIEDSDEERIRRALYMAAGSLRGLAHVDPDAGEGSEVSGAVWTWSLVGGYTVGEAQTADGSRYPTWEPTGEAGFEPPRLDPSSAPAYPGARIEAEQVPWCAGPGRDEGLGPIADRLAGLSGDATGAVLATVQWATMARNRQRPALVVFVDAHGHLGGQSGDMFVRALRDAAVALRNTQTTLVLTSPEFRVPGESDGGLPPELRADARLVRPGLPGTVEIGEVIAREIAGNYDGAEITCSRDALIDAARGGTCAQIADWIAESMYEHGEISCEYVRARKGATLSDLVGVTYVDTPATLADVGGLDILKGYLTTNRAGLSARARELGVALKGLALVGPAGTGKSLVAKVVASNFQCPLLICSIGALMNKWVGNSESNLRAVLQAAEAVAPCVLMLDEIEKAIGGGEGDGGTSSRMFGELLTWLQECPAPVFVVATANDADRIPPETLRDGRCDEIFGLDYPTTVERTEILRIHLRKRGQELPDDEIAAVAARHGRGLPGASLEGAVKVAIRAADPDLTGESQVTGDILARVLDSRRRPADTPINQRRRAWIEANATPASSPDAAPAVAASPAGRAVARKTA